MAGVDGKLLGVVTAGVVVALIVIYFAYINTHAQVPPLIPGSNTTTSIAAQGELAVNLTQELNNSAQSGFVLNKTVFYSTSVSQCEKEQIAPCDNNNPDQFICVNRQYAADVAMQYNGIYSGREGVCALYFMEGTISCGLSDNYCVVYFASTVNAG